MCETFQPCTGRDLLPIHNQLIILIVKVLIFKTYMCDDKNMNKKQICIFN